MGELRRKNSQIEPNFRQFSRRRMNDFVAELRLFSDFLSNEH